MPEASEIEYRPEVYSHTRAWLRGLLAKNPTMRRHLGERSDTDTKAERVIADLDEETLGLWNIYVDLLRRGRSLLEQKTKNAPTEEEKNRLKNYIQEFLQQLRTTPTSESADRNKYYFYNFLRNISTTLNEIATYLTAETDTPDTADLLDDIAKSGHLDS